VVEGIVEVAGSGFLLCQSPHCWRDLGTDLVGLLRCWVAAVGEEGALAAAY
jgi:hypothetical protein